MDEVPIVGTNIPGPMRIPDEEGSFSFLPPAETWE
jgi:hypothetical protein